MASKAFQLSPHVEYYVVYPYDSPEDHIRGTWSECRDHLKENPGGKILFDTPDIHLFPSRMKH